MNFQREGIIWACFKATLFIILVFQIQTRYIVWSTLKEDLSRFIADELHPFRISISLVPRYTYQSFTKLFVLQLSPTT